MVKLTQRQRKLILEALGDKIESFNVDQEAEIAEVTELHDLLEANYALEEIRS